MQGADDIAGRIAGLRARGQLGPAIGLAGVGASALAMATVAFAFPQAAPGLSAAMADALAACNPFAGGLGVDSGCGHGFGCSCHVAVSARASLP